MLRRYVFRNSLHNWRHEVSHKWIFFQNHWMDNHDFREWWILGVWCWYFDLRSWFCSQGDLSRMHWGLFSLTLVHNAEVCRDICRWFFVRGWLNRISLLLIRGSQHWMKWQLIRLTKMHWMSHSFLQDDFTYDLNEHLLQWRILLTLTSFFMFLIKCLLV